MLDRKAMRLVISLEFASKKRFKWKKIENSIYVRNMNGVFNKKRLIGHTVEVNIYYWEYKERIAIKMIGEKKWSVILDIPQFASYNYKIDWKTGEVNMTRCLDEYRKQ